MTARKKNDFRLLLVIYSYFSIYLIVLVCTFLLLAFTNSLFIQIPIGVFSLYLFLWKIPWYLWRKSGFRKRFYPFLPITSILFYLFLGFAVPSFKEPEKSAVQRGMEATLASYVKASQAFFIEYGKLATSTKDIGQYITVTGCWTTGAACEDAQLIDYSNLEFTRWYSPSGNYEIEMKSENDQNIFVATPTEKIKKKGLGAFGCFNSKNGKTKILGIDIKGTNVEIANCSD